MQPTEEEQVILDALKENEKTGMTRGDFKDALGRDLRQHDYQTLAAMERMGFIKSVKQKHAGPIGYQWRYYLPHTEVPIEELYNQ